MRRNLTKSPLPLIIIMVLVLGMKLGVGEFRGVASAARKERPMKVLIHKDADGQLSALVIAAPGKGRPPVLVQRVTPEDIAEKLLPIVEEIRRPKEPRGRG